MTQPIEVSVPPQLLKRILELADNGMILVGGQALAFWTAYYNTPAPFIAITKDVDFLGTKADVERMARGLDARAVFPREGATSLLVGQVQKDLPGGNYINIDVMFRVYGDITTKAIAGRAVPAESPAGPFLVMHPLDVLQGRLENVYGLSAKKDEHGLAQLRVAIDVARKFVGDIGSQEASGVGTAGRPVALRHLARIERLALSDAGRKVARRHGLHVADAIDPAPVRHISQFVDKQFPRILKLMSAQRRAELQMED
ncbi:MAG: hypothetical protein QOI59_3632 [Gammaproteobacteria bacterium]|nr:hypothetical protein [Gammaproteobacteria bacterium]